MIINTKRARQALAFCALLFYPFNNTISNKILFTSLNPYIFIILGVALLLPDIRRRVSKRVACLAAIEVLIIILILLNNELSGQYGHVVIQLAYLFILPILMNIDIDKKAVTISIIIFTAEHVLGTLYPIILPGVYENSFLPFICNASGGYCPASIAFHSGMNAGITGQSSTNGCYMAILAIFHASKYLAQKDKKSLLLTIATIVCLLVIGKRAHMLFVAVSLLITYITKNNHFSLSGFVKNNLRAILIITLSLIGVLAVSNTIPQVRSTIDRIAASKDSDDVTSRRGPLYELAILKWKEKPILGNGWGAYIMASHEKFGISTYGSDYMHAHNDYLEILCDKGIVGLAFYLVILVWILKKTYCARNGGYFNKFAFAYIIFYMLYSLTGTPLYIISNFVFLLATLIIYRREDEKNWRNNIQ